MLKGRDPWRSSLKTREWEALCRWLRTLLRRSRLGHPSLLVDRLHQRRVFIPATTTSVSKTSTPLHASKRRTIVGLLLHPLRQRSRRRKLFPHRAARGRIQKSRSIRTSLRINDLLLKHPCTRAVSVSIHHRNLDQLTLIMPMHAGSVKQTGLRPLLLRAESAQSIRAPVLKIDASTPDIPSGPLTSTPKKQKQASTTFGTPLSPATAARNANNNRTSGNTPSKKGGVGGVRDSKELVAKSPGTAKTLQTKNGGEEGKENVRYWQGRSPRKAVVSPQKQTPAQHKASSTSLSDNSFCGSY